MATTNIPNDFEQPQYILIDSSPSVVFSWNLVAEKRGIKIATFTSILNFHKVKHQFNKDIPLYINYQHGELNGVECAKELYDYGFTNIYLETAFTKYYIEGKENISWLKGITDKFPPFADESTIL